MWGFFEKSTSTKSRIYLDYAGATPVLPEAVDAVVSATRLYGNPGAIHSDGVAAKRSLTRSRERIAHELACKARELIFVSGGTEANNLAILGFARSIERNSLRSDLKGPQGPTFGISPLSQTHWIVSSIEHPSVLDCFGEVERLGGTVDFVDPDKHGRIQPEAVARLLRPETVFISIGWGNGEIGVIQPLARIARVVRAHEEKNRTTIIFHTDAGQAPLYDPANVHSLGVDLLTLDSGKLYGPRGVGCVYLNDRVTLVRVQLGGGQERGLRAGTENIALAAGFAEAFSIIAKERESESKRLSKMRDDLACQIVARVPGALINGDLARSMPHMLNISFPDITSEYLLLALDHAGISLSTKSACREGEEKKSHVVEAIALAVGASVKGVEMNEWRSKNTLRFSLGRGTTQKDVERVSDVLAGLVIQSQKIAHESGR